jgi:hypothetical protein
MKNYLSFSHSFSVCPFLRPRPGEGYILNQITTGLIDEELAEVIEMLNNVHSKKDKQ